MRDTVKSSCFLFILAGLICWVLSVNHAAASWYYPTTDSNGVCGVGTGLPPFLGSSVDPNLLVILDNSGSMYDLGYQDATRSGECYDDSYDTSVRYGGYFDSTLWYYYDFTDEEFKETTEADALVLCAAAGGTVFSKDSVLCLSDDDTDGTMDNVVAFAANGGFLNWAAASKFDIEKKILTGGKYEWDEDNNDGTMVMETRGCSNRRFVKKVTLDQEDSGVKYTLSLGIRPPMEEDIERWDTDTQYADNDKVLYNGKYYKADSSRDSSDSVVTQGVAPTGETDNDWALYYGNYWYPDVEYSVGDVVLDEESDKMYKALTSGTSLASATELAEDTSITWELYNLTHIEIFSVTMGGFDYEACYNALNEMNNLDGTTDDGSTDDSNSSLGKLKGYIADCMGYSNKDAKTQEGYLISAFNHSVQECWYYNKFDRFQPGSGSVNALMNDCEKVYATIPPSDLTAWDNAYVCGGEYGAFPPYEYIGRCWKPAGGVSGGGGTTPCPSGTNVDDTWKDTGTDYICVDDDGSEVTAKCTGSGNSKCDTYVIVTDSGDAAEDAAYAWTDDSFYVYDDCMYMNCDLTECVVPACASYNDATGNTCPAASTTSCDWEDAAWTRDINATDSEKTGWWMSDADGELCVEQAMRDFCASMDVVEVIDPSDATGLTGEVWNAPAMLVDSGIVAQLDKPIATMQGYIAVDAEPEGILQEVADDIRIGVMTFNQNGADYECGKTEADGTRSDAIRYDCPDDNRDGGRIIAYIDQDNDDTGNNHTEQLVEAINDIKADAWTPLAEAMYSALGYYGQKDTMFSVTNSDATVDDFSSRLNGTNDFLLPSEVPEVASLSLWVTSTAYAEGDIVLDSSDNKYVALNSGTSSGTEPEDDAGVEWLRLPEDLDPVEYSCQHNNILILTEGASTADINETVKAFIKNHELDDDGDQVTVDVSAGDDEPGECDDGLYGSTFLDDLTWYGHNAAVSDLYASPTMDDGEDKNNITTYIITTGTVATGTDECAPGELMEDAAQHGRDLETGEVALFDGSDPSSLEAKLQEVFSKILNRASAGSAASVISSSRDGEGAVYQAIFWPQRERGTGADDKLEWTGDVHALFIDDNGWLFEDTDGDAMLSTEDANGNGVLDEGEDKDDDDELDGDRRVVLYYDDSYGETRACMNDSVTTTGTCDDYVSLFNINYIWSASEWLADLSGTQVSANRGVDGTTGKWDFSSKGRYIFTWNDLDNDGIVDYASDGTNEVLEFTVDIDWANLAVNQESFPYWRGSVINDFAVMTDTELDDLITWVRGTDSSTQRDRSYRAADGTDKTWRLGDVIHSAPTLAASPAESYHYVYRDPSYLLFAKQYKSRRHVIYFGGNDGMMHAINGGFYVESKKGFLKCAEEDLDDDGDCPANSPDLGTELWAYVPYNLQPHLKCLADPDYDHKYYVDQRPRLFDVQIFEDDCTYNSNGSTDCSNAEHPGGWGTILVGSMGLGGAPLKIDEMDAATTDYTDERRFQSTYFILEITNPEKPPVLLGEMTRFDDWGQSNYDEHARLGYTTPSPTMVVMRDSSLKTDAAGYGGITKWYLILGNGPNDLDGENHVLPGTLAVLPLEWLLGSIDMTTGLHDTSTKRAFRILNQTPSDATHQGGVFKMKFADMTEPSSYIWDGGVKYLRAFTSDSITVDFDIENPQNDTANDYRADVVYFGTVEGEEFTSFWDNGKKKTKWPNGGRMMRLVMDPNDTGAVTTPSQWELKEFMNVGRPVTGAASVGFDDTNYWVYFGTGRFFATDDKTDPQEQYFFGIKEPLATGSTCTDINMTWDTVTSWDADNHVGYDPTAGTPVIAVPGNSPGSQGVLRVDPIQVRDITSTTNGIPYLYCDDGNGGLDVGSACMPDEAAYTDTYNNTTYYQFSELKRYIAGENCYELSNDTNNGIDGWYRVLDDSRERNLSQATLLGGLVTFTSYQPYESVCLSEGLSYLYAVHYQTGTAYYENVFGTDEYADDDPNDSEQMIIVQDRLPLGQGQASTPNLHVGTSHSNPWKKGDAGDEGDNDGGGGGGGDEDDEDDGDDDDDHDATAFVQTSTGEIVEISQENLPISDYRTGQASWLRLDEAEVEARDANATTEEDTAEETASP